MPVRVRVEVKTIVEIDVKVDSGIVAQGMVENRLNPAWLKSQMWHAVDQERYGYEIVEIIKYDEPKDSGIPVFKEE